MTFHVRAIAQAARFSDELTLEALNHLVTQADILAVLAAQGRVTPRNRKLNLVATCYLVLGLHLFPRSSVKRVFANLARGLRFIWPQESLVLPGESALSYRRTQLGARPLVALFQRVARPFATAQTRGAWLCGLRLVAVDSTLETVPDTAGNRAAFGGPSNAQGVGAYPQVRAVYLAECGTHGLLDAGLWPYATSERLGAWRLLRTITPEMLLMWDRGFHEWALLRAVRRRGAQVLGRLPSNIHPEWIADLPDGSWRAYLYPADEQLRRTEREEVRIIEYTFDDPPLAGHGERHRLVTTLLDPAAAPARVLALAYHERWEIELVIDEIDTHQRLPGRPLRSLTPVGIIQEVYGLLIAYNAVRQLMHEAALTVDVDPDRLSFVGALEVVTGALREFQQTAPQDHAQLYRRMLADIAAERLPPRRARVNPRVVKRQQSKFPVKRPEHRHPPQPARPIAQSLALI
jgi:hypothetical protein